MRHPVAAAVLTAVMTSGPLASDLLAQPAATVYLHDYTFSTNPLPDEPGDNTVTVDVGQTVRWVWVANFHSVVQVNGPGAGTNPFQSILTEQIGFVFEHTFTAPGTYGYICEIHGSAPQPDHPQGMWGSVIVIPAPHAGLAVLACAGGLVPRRRRDR